MADSIAISCERRGSGEPLVLIHGLGATRLVWKPQIEALGGRARRDRARHARLRALATRCPRGTPPTAAALGSAISDFLARTSGSSARTSPATRSAAGSRWRWRRPGAPPRPACSPRPASGRTRSARARSTPRGIAKLLKPRILALARAARAPARGCCGRWSAGPRTVPVEDALQMIRDWIEAPGYADSNEEMRRHVFEDPETVDRAGDDRLGRARPARGPAEVAPATARQPSSSCSRAADTRRTGTTPS